MKKLLDLFGRNKSLLKLTIPIFFELLLTFLVGAIDSIQISFDQTAVSAINQANTLTNLINITFSVLSISSIIMITQLKEVKREDLVRKIYVLSFYLNLFLGLILSFIIFFFARDIFLMMGVESEYIDKALIYIRWTGGATFLTAIFTSFSAFLRSNKLMIQSTFISLIINLVNIGGNFLALYVFKAGIEGVAISSVIARTLSVILIIGVYIKYIKASLNPRHLFHFPRKLFGRLLKIGLPSAGESFSYNLAQFVVLIILNRFFFITQSIDVNIRSYILNCTFIVYMFSIAISQAGQVTLGATIALKDFEKSDKQIKDIIKISMLITMVGSILFLAIGYPILNFLLKIDDVVHKKEAMRLVMIILALDILLEIGRSGNIPLIRALQASGDVYYPIIISVAMCWLLAVGGSALFTGVFGLGVLGCWIANILDENTRFLIFLFRFKKGSYKKFHLIDDLKR